MAGEVEGQDGESAVGEPAGEWAPPVEVPPLVVHEHGPAVCLAGALAAQDDVIGARKLDRDQPPRGLPVGGQRLLQQLDADLNVPLQGPVGRAQVSCFQR